MNILRIKIIFWTCALVLTATVVGAIALVPSFDQREIRMTSFEHIGPGRASLSFTQSDRSVTTARLFSGEIGSGEEVLSAISNKPGENSNGTVSGKATVSISFPKQIEDQDDRASQYYVELLPTPCVFVQKHFGVGVRSFWPCESSRYLEIIRQSPAFLKSLGIEKPDGYSIAGRTNLAVEAEDRKLTAVPETIVNFNKLPKVALSTSTRDALNTDNGAVLEAARLVKMLYSSPLRMGGSKISRIEFESKSINGRLQSLWDGEAGTMCADLRDIWLKTAQASPNIPKARSVDAYNTYPHFGDLTPFSHALAEFYVAEWKKWVLIDPWFGFVLRSEGTLLDAAGLSAMSNDEVAAVEIVPVVPQISKFSMDVNGNRQVYNKDPKSNAPPLISSFGIRGFSIGYADYFNIVEYGPDS